MTVEKLRKAAEELIARDKDMPIKYREYAAAVSAFDEAVSALTPERVLALCELARVMDDTHLIARQSPDWPGERFLNGTDEGTLALEALAAIEAAFGESEDD